MAYCWVHVDWIWRTSFQLPQSLGLLPGNSFIQLKSVDEIGDREAKPQLAHYACVSTAPIQIFFIVISFFGFAIHQREQCQHDRMHRYLIDVIIYYICIYVGTNVFMASSWKKKLHAVCKMFYLTVGRLIAINSVQVATIHTCRCWNDKNATYRAITVGVNRPLQLCHRAPGVNGVVVVERR